MRKHKGPSSLSSFAEERGAIIDYHSNNPEVARIDTPAPGVHFFEAANPVSDELIVLSAGLHGDELAGTRIIDALRKETYDGDLSLRRHVAFVDGNLKAMQQALKGMHNGVPASARYWNKDACYGIEANANRMWNRTDLSLSKNYDSYAGQRRQLIWRGLNDILLGGSDTREGRSPIQHQDLHQSFAVPKVKEIRGEYEDDSEYTYGMAYDSTQYFSERFAAVYAGLVGSDPREAQTFAGITARELKAKSVTAELGAITSSDEVTYAHKMLEALRNELEGLEPLVSSVAPDVWRQIEPIIRLPEAPDFAFYEAGTNKLITPPRDFVPLDKRIEVPLSPDENQFIEAGRSLLFANPNVVIGDRAGVVIERASV